MERKKIILIATSDINYDQRLQKIANSLSGFGADVSLIGRQTKHSVDLQKRAFYQDRLTCFFNKGILFYLEMNIRLFFYLLTKKADIVCANDADTLMAALMAKFFKSFELIYDSHEYFTEVPELQGKTFKKLVWKKLEQIGVRQSSRCYTVNESLSHLFSQSHHKTFEVIRNVPVLTETKSAHSKEDYIFYQGALNSGRGLEVLIKAMQNVELTLKIAGKGDVEAELKLLVKQLKLEDKVMFLGYLLPKDLEKLTANAKIGANLLESTSLNYYYSLANKFFDYMHAGVPSINMSFPEYEIINKEWELAVLIDELKVEKVTQAIQLLLKDQALYDRLVENSLKAKYKFHWQLEETKLKDIYQL